MVHQLYATKEFIKCTQDITMTVFICTFTYLIIDDTSSFSSNTFALPQEQSCMLQKMQDRNKTICHVAIKTR